MKRLLILLCALLLLTCAAQAETVYVYDSADVLSSSEESLLADRLSALCESYGIDALIAFTDESHGMDAYDYVDYIYSELRSSGSPRDAAVFAVCLDNRTYRLEAFGRVSSAMNAYGWDGADARVQRLLSADRYYDAAAAWTEILQDACAPKSPFATALSYMGFVAIIGVLAALIAVVVMIRQLKTARFQDAASGYVIDDSLTLRDTSEIFLYETVSVRKIEQHHSPGGGGRSGGGGGRSGRGGSF